MPQYSRGVRGGSQVAPAYPDILGTDHHGSQGWSLLWSSLQGMPRSYPGIPPVPHNIQHGRGLRHRPLGDGGGSNRGGNGETCTFNMVLGGVLILQQWTRRVKPTGEAASGVRSPCMPL